MLHVPRDDTLETSADPTGAPHCLLRFSRGHIMVPSWQGLSAEGKGDSSRFVMDRSCSKSQEVETWASSILNPGDMNPEPGINMSMGQTTVISCGLYRGSFNGQVIWPPSTSQGHNKGRATPNQLLARLRTALSEVKTIHDFWAGSTCMRNMREGPDSDRWSKDHGTTYLSFWGLWICL